MLLVRSVDGHLVWRVDVSNYQVQPSRITKYTPYELKHGGAPTDSQSCEFTPCSEKQHAHIVSALVHVYLSNTSLLQDIYVLRRRFLHIVVRKWLAPGRAQAQPKDRNCMPMFRRDLGKMSHSD